MVTNYNWPGPNARYATEFNKEVNGITCISRLPEEFKKIDRSQIVANKFVNHVRVITKNQNDVFTKEAQEAYEGALDYALKQVQRGTLHEGYLKAAKRLLQSIDIVKGALPSLSKMK